MLSGGEDAVGCVDLGGEPLSCATSATASAPLLLLFARLFSATAVSRACVGRLVTGTVVASTGVSGWALSDSLGIPDDVSAACES